MLKNVLSSEVQSFIRDHEQDDERQVVLRHKEVAGVPSSVIADQISGRRKAKDKIPTYYNASNIIYPPGINLEQTSSEKTAIFKSALLSDHCSSPSRETVGKQSLRQGVDLTGGFGIDTYFLSKLFSLFHYIEPNTRLLEIAKHNHQQLDTTNIQYHNNTAENFLSQLNHAVDFIFIDPSRRSENKKVFTFSDSEPNVVSLQEKIFEKSGLLMIKASPLLDIKLALKELSSVKKVFVLSVENEVRELLFLCMRGFVNGAYIEAVNLSKQGTPRAFGFQFSEEENTDVSYSDPLLYLYEPGASILKAGAFKTISKRFALSKIHPSTHFYTSDLLVENFPGRIFKVEARVKPHPRALMEFFPEGKANVVARNYPLSVADLKRKTGISDGGSKFLIAFSGVKEKFVCVATRLRDTWQ